MKKKLVNIFFISSILLFLSCDQKTDVKSENRSVNQDIKILLSDPVETLDPIKILYASDWKVAANIFESLVAFDEEGKVVPELTEYFSICEGRQKYTFKLRDNVYFQDNPCFKSGKGRKLNSFDIKYTFERLANPKNNFPNWQMISNKILGINKFHNGEEKSIQGIVIEDSLTISFLLSKPFGSFLKILATPNYYIVPKEAIEYFGKEFKHHPVGTGPFRISEFRKYEKVQLVKNVIEKYSSDIYEKRITVEKNFICIEKIFELDENLIIEVIENLMTNAIYFSTENSVIQIEIQNEKSNIVFTICDEGVGIPEENYDNIFHPFFTTKSSGSGLGLSIAKNIIEAHNGSIEIFKKNNMGACLKIILPIN